MDFFEAGVGANFFLALRTRGQSRDLVDFFFEAGVGAKFFFLALRTRGQSRDLVDFF